MVYAILGIWTQCVFASMIWKELIIYMVSLIQFSESHGYMSNLCSSLLSQANGNSINTIRVAYHALLLNMAKYCIEYHVYSIVKDRNIYDFYLEWKPTYLSLTCSKQHTRLYPATLCTKFRCASKNSSLISLPYSCKKYDINDNLLFFFT